MALCSEVTIVRIPARHAVRNAFAGRSTNGKDVDYYATKGHAVNAFDAVLQDYDLHFDRADLPSFNGDEGWATLRICNEFDHGIGYARLSWYRMPSGRYEFTGYIS
jgi:hypothetical protein